MHKVFDLSGDIAPMYDCTRIHYMGCLKRGWLCVSLVVEVYCGWGMMANEGFYKLLGVWPFTLARDALDEIYMYVLSPQHYSDVA